MWWCADMYIVMHHQVSNQHIPNTLNLVSIIFFFHAENAHVVGRAIEK